MSLALLLFLMWASVLWVGFTYLGYPLVLWALRALSPRPLASADITPSLSILIAVHDGAAELRRKLEETLALAYGGERQVIVSSDGSTDASEDVAREFADRGVELVACPEQRGKESAQATAIARARGDVLVFTDVSARLEPDALERIVRPFADASVGCVSSEDVVEGESGEGAYVRYEMALRRLESEAATLVGCSGSFFAARRELCTPWPPDLASDFRSALETARRGLRAVSEPSARARFGVTAETGAEWNRKVRTVRRGIAVLAHYRGLLHPRHGRVALALWGHKLARFTAPVALLLLLVTSALAAGQSTLAAAAFAAQAVFYVLGGLRLAGVGVGLGRIPRLAGFFLLTNASVLVAWVYHLSGQRAVVWEPTRR